MKSKSLFKGFFLLSLITFWLVPIKAFAEGEQILSVLDTKLIFNEIQKELAKEAKLNYAYLEPEAVPRVCYPVFSVQQFLFIQPHVEMQSIVQPAIHLPQ